VLPEKGAWTKGAERASSRAFPQKDEAFLGEWERLVVHSSGGKRRQSAASATNEGSGGVN